MTASELNQLVGQVGGAQLAGFVLVLARISPLFLLAPLFSSKMVPARVRGVIAVALAIGLTGVAMHGQRIPGSPLQLGGLMLEQVLVGLAFAFSLGALFAAIETAGSLVDAVAGFSFGSLIDPITGNQAAILSQLYALLGALIFIAIGGDAWVLRGLGRTFDLVPLTKAPRLGPLLAGTEHVFGTIFAAAIEVAAPVLLALMITDVAFGMVSRVVPQLNVFAVGFPMKVAVAMLVVSASLPFLGGWMSDQLTGVVGSALQELKVA
jgi:flagellar biosynthesis protein FliR